MSASDGQILNLATKRVQAVPCSRDGKENAHSKHLSAKEAIKHARSKNLKTRLAYVAKEYGELATHALEMNALFKKEFDRSATRQLALLSNILNNDITYINAENEFNKNNDT